MSFAPAFANGRYISMGGDAGVAPQRSKFRRSVRPVVPDIAGIQKQTSQLFFYSKDITHPL